MDVAEADKLWALRPVPPPNQNGIPSLPRTELLRQLNYYKLENSKKMSEWRGIMIERVQKQLLPADAVMKAASQANRILRDHLLVLPERVAPVLAAMQDQDEIRRYLLADIRRALETIAGVYHNLAELATTNKRVTGDGVNQRNVGDFH